MKSICQVFCWILFLLMSSCTSEPTLQKYIVENAEKKDFVVFDMSSDIINADKSKLSGEQLKALQSFDKMNILVFKKSVNNTAQYNLESEKVAKLLENKAYNELMKVGSGSDMISVSYLGNEDAIDEFVLFAKKKENGFGIVRVLGNDMNPNNVLQMISILKDNSIKMDALQPLQDLIVK